MREVMEPPGAGAGFEREFPGVADATPIEATADRAVARVAGVIRSIAIGPRGPSAVFEAELVDRTGALRLIWLGQRQILGLEPGRSLICEGRIGLEDGERVMRNPRYEIIPVGTAE
ncbi:MAG: OB-fold nucleic acid binding domain-containing protein [Bifidobacteriaceae bacterium]|nr:OB-fold nucleic acid binding domain-containing protein [Bifidobacteriaceae bacterium]